MENDQRLSPLLISDRVFVNGTVTPLTLTGGGELRWSEDGQPRLIVAKDVLSFAVEGNKVRVKAVLVVERAEGICCCVTSKGDFARKDFVFEPLTDDSRKLWCERLREYLDSLGRPKKLLVFVNPFGGNKSASKIFQEDVKPLLQDADIQLTVRETQYQLHAKEIIRSLDLSIYDGIVCISGDGILVEGPDEFIRLHVFKELRRRRYHGTSLDQLDLQNYVKEVIFPVVNGLLQREDWRDAIKMPIGIVPAGTGNGMIKSLMDSVGLSCSATNAAISIIRGHKRSLDVATILQGNTRYFSILMLAWGLVADIDIESEKYRWMGSARLDFYALQRIIHLRRYNGRILFLPAPGFESLGQPASYVTDAADVQDNCSPDKEPSVKAQKIGYCGPETNFENPEWREINGPFVSVWLHNVPWGAENTLAAPDAKFSDGFLDLIVIKDCPKLALLSLMTKMSDGGHVKSPYSIYLKVKAFILEPGTRVEDPEREGIIDADGEVLARGRRTYKSDHEKALMSYGKLQISVDRGLATLFSPQ